MSVIELLSENLVNQIAAGEVVERPASVVKELVENSLDAGADRIVLEINDGGKSLIKVSDNGKGIAKEDLELALQRHATSKINHENDLWNIRTMGFRGEALASIASVSNLLIRSKRAEDLAGHQLNCDGGKVGEIEEVGMSVGTQIEVHNLFYNTPARQKYLKKDATELSRITTLMNQIALANPAISFKVMHNKRVISDWPKSSDLIARVADVLGNTVAEAMLPLFYGGDQMEIEGFIGKPLLSRTTNQHQYTFVNGRPIQHHLLANRIKAAYHSMLMEHKKPVFVLNIKIDPSLIDVNVHPRKLEIRFEDQQSLVRIVYGCVKSALEKTSLIPRGYSESKNYMSDSFPRVNQASAVREPRPSYQSESSFNWKPAAKMVQDSMIQEESKPEEVIRMIALAQVNKSYIVAKNVDGLVLIDQHAGHERVRYEELMRQFKEKKKVVQSLLTPLTIELSQDEAALVEEHRDVFEGLGFEIEHFGGNSFVVRALPSCLAKEDLDDVVKGVLDDLINDDLPTEIQGKVEEMLTYMSCRSAIKFGQSLSLPEMQSLIEQMAKLERPYTCPHGRPTMVSLDMKELGKMFGRL